MMDNKEKTFVSSVIYVHNAENRIEEFLTAIIRVMEDNFEHSEVICVNDGSSDMSAEKIRSVGKTADTTIVSIVNMSYFHGLELAMNAGRDIAIGDFVFEFDNTDLDFIPGFVMDVYRRSLEGYDIVSASPDIREKPSSRLFYNVFDRFTDLSYKMTTESFRVLSRRVINRISSMNKSVPYRKAIYAGSGLKTDNLKYKADRKRIRVSDRSEKRYRTGLAMDSLILFTKVGYRFSMVMTFVMMAVSILMVAYAVITYIVVHPVEGWFTTIIFLSFAFFGLFGILTIIIKYLQLIIDMIFKRKAYSFESVEKITK